MFHLEGKNSHFKSKLLQLLQLHICRGPRFVNDRFSIQLNGTVHALSPPLWFEAAIMRLLSVVLQHLTVAEKHIAKYMYTHTTQTHILVHLYEDSLEDNARSPKPRQ